MRCVGVPACPQRAGEPPPATPVSGATTTATGALVLPLDQLRCLRATHRVPLPCTLRPPCHSGWPPPVSRYRAPLLAFAGAVLHDATRRLPFGFCVLPVCILRCPHRRATACCGTPHTHDALVAAVTRMTFHTHICRYAHTFAVTRENAVALPRLPAHARCVAVWTALLPVILLPHHRLAPIAPRPSLLACQVLVIPACPPTCCPASLGRPATYRVLICACGSPSCV